MEHIALGMQRDTALKISGLTLHKYYFKSTSSSNKRGAKASRNTLKMEEGKWVEKPNSEVVEKMKKNHNDPDLCYGYQRMTKELQINGYQINHKKVYRLMKVNDLLQDRKKTSNKTFVKYRLVTPNGPLELLEMDIKFVWIESQGRHGYILTILDVFTRMVLGWHVGMSITQHTVKEVFSSVIIEQLQPHDMLAKGITIEIRNDNDPRFSAKSVQDFFKENYLNQVFTHPYTPQENGHVESFHAILGRSLDRQYFETLEQAECHLVLFYEKYNNTRLHGSIANLSPRTFWQQWNLGNINRRVLEKKKVKFKLIIPYHQLLDNGNQKEASCLNCDSLEERSNSLLNEVSGAEALQQLSVQRSPSVASC